MVPHLQNEYDLTSIAGLEALHMDAMQCSVPADAQARYEHIWSSLTTLHETDPPRWDDPLTPASLELLFSAVDIQSCFRIVDPICQSTQLAAKLSERYQRLLARHKTQHPHPKRLLEPGHYRRLSVKGPIDWVFLYPPVDLIDLSLAIATAFARVGVALWAPISYLSNLSSNRLRMLQPFKASNRLTMIREQGASHCWLCIFATPGHRSQMMTPSSAKATAWVSF